MIGNQFPIQIFLYLFQIFVCNCRFDTEDTTPQKRNWYQHINAIKYPKDTKWQVTVQLPRSKWDSEDEETISVSTAKEEIKKPINKLHVSVVQRK